jgi:hypothetical protein
MRDYTICQSNVIREELDVIRKLQSFFILEELLESSEKKYDSIMIDQVYGRMETLKALAELKIANAFKTTAAFQSMITSSLKILVDLANQVSYSLSL